jgi:DNA-binding winged helix-turn-helix (wHTH) protein/tetratricopeptide (TPR) repeat protein
MMQERKHLYEFGPFRFQPEERLLSCDGQPVTLSPRGFEALNILVLNAGRLVTKQELMEAIWGDACVEPGNLTVTISTLRKALGEEHTERKYVQTVSKLGYRFVAQVREVQPETPSAAASPNRTVFGGGSFRYATVMCLLVAGGSLLWMRSSPVRADSSQDPAPRGTALLRDALFRSPLWGPNPDNPAEKNRRAQELYLYGRYCWNRRTDESLRRSVRYFEEALAADPNSARVHAGLADSYTTLSSRDVERTTYLRARSSALRALELDPSLPDAHAAFGYVLLIQDRDWRGAEREFQKAIALDPNCAIAHQRYGLALAAAGRFEESRDELRRAAQADPLSLIINTDVGWGLYLGRRYDEAISAYRKVLELDPNFGPAHTFLGLAYVHKGDFTEAVRELEESRRITRDTGYAPGFLGYAQARSGDTPSSRRTLNQLTGLMQTQHVSPFGLAVLYVGLGQNEQAMEWLEKSYQARNTIAVYAKTDPSLDPLRSDPRFSRFIQRMGF